MARRIKTWLSFSDLEKRLVSGKAYQISARIRDGEFFVFYRESGACYWYPVANENKQGQVSYKVKNLYRLLEKLRSFGCQFQFELDGSLYKDFEGPMTCVEELARQFNALELRHKNAVLALIGLDRNASLLMVADAILFDHAQRDSVTESVIRTFISWPGELPEFDNAPCMSASSLPDADFSFS